jgi:hypothetical protein
LHDIVERRCHVGPSTAEHETSYLAHTLLSSGMHQPATILFQQEPPSGSDAITAQSSQASPISQPIEQTFENTPATLPAPQETGDEGCSITPPTLTPSATQTALARSLPDQAEALQKVRRSTNDRAVTMADISRGFIRGMQQEAGYNKPAQDIRELTLQLYATKLWNIIKNAFLSGDNGMHLQEDIRIQAHLIVTIERSGALRQIHLDYPKDITAARQIERLIVSRAQRAGLFPPLPAGIPGTSKTFSFPLLIEGQKGFHAYALGYQGTP